MVNVRQEGAVDVRELDSIVDRIAVNRDCRETLSRRCNRSRLVRAAQKREIALRGRRYRGQPNVILAAPGGQSRRQRDRKSTRLNSSHSQISYAVLCLKKKEFTANINTRPLKQSNRESSRNAGC